MIVIASIHQPSTKTLLLFDNVLLLSEGKTCYFGPPEKSVEYFSSLSYNPPPLVSPAEFMLDLINVDFVGQNQTSRLESLIQNWQVSLQRKHLDQKIAKDKLEAVEAGSNRWSNYPRGLFAQCWILLHRMTLKSYRDPLAYGVRIAMYLGLAILMGTAWLRLSYAQENIFNTLNSLFFGSAFMSFMVHPEFPILTGGGGVYSSIFRGPRCDGEGAREWTVRTNSLPDRQYYHRPSLSL